MEKQPARLQQYSINYILEHPVAAVILFMGAGKTVITLTAIQQLMHDRFEVSKVLIVAPLRVAKNTWPTEIRQWSHLSDLTYSVVAGTEKERKSALAKKADIYIINRENLQWLVESSGYPFDFDMCVLDDFAFYSLMDLFAEFKCLDLGERLGRFIGQYRLNYFTPDRMNGQIVYSYKLLPGAEDRIYEKISDITVSMKALDHLNMPELLSLKYPVFMDEAEKQKYQTMKKDMIIPYLEGEDITAVNAAALSNKLCQMANGCVYSDDGNPVLIHDRKLDALEDIIEAAQGPILVCYWYKHDLERITKRLDALKVEYGRISSEGSIKMWNEGQFQVGLIHPASAGHGLNLQKGGNTMVFFSVNWSLELYDQVVARLWRQGQQASTVVVQHIVCDGTIDGNILDALSRKEKSQTALIDAVKAQL